MFNDDGEVGFEDWDVWNPGFDPTHPHVTCGPYVFSSYETGDSYILTKNPEYHYLPAESVSTTTDDSTLPSDVDNPWLGAVATAVSVAVVEVTFVVAIIAYRDHHRNK